jgi:hypothetical protein
MLYNCTTTPRGIRFQTADGPLGPWDDVVLWQQAQPPFSPTVIGQLITAPSLVFDPDACQDPNCLLGGAYEKFMHLVGADTLYDNAFWVSTGVQPCDLIPVIPLTLVPPRINENGGEYAPYVIQRFTTGAPNTTTIYYTLSTWNPYQVHLLKTTLHKPILPVAMASAPTTVAVGADCTAKVALDGSASTHDPYTPPLKYTWTWTGPGGASGTASGAHPTISLGLGTFTITLTVDDGLATSSSTIQVSTRDPTPPVVTSSVALSSLLLFDHNLVNAGLTATAVDNCDGVRPVSVSVFSNESETTPKGDGAFSPDAKYLAPGTLVLRDERIGSATGRVYLIEVTAQDKAGNIGVACPTVVVPHDLSSASSTFVNMQAASAAAYCQANVAAPTGYFADGYGPEIGPKQ